ncbi:carboxyvinyl-carboxyphosphonate phosphorylmutase [Aeromicrobium sp. PE09-221]|uniref:isocitrate lyase/PEP mutase family protein n=1 Tax=Aeromicrobium sp. PE09-221 TaxID=1898043 RepID=UPI000B3E913F|nr:isocitrate lyase/PEP mutase family protein [Aeromicrobium sp. PE09-221]OUZ12753.1 carboxyvinyl-carboxyphosphonate phosphorylmutase [Aeromicrobium sp. PE09-221]
MSDAQVLSDLLRADRLLAAPGVYDGLSAAVAARAGVKAAYVSGAAVSASEGLPDIGLTTVTEVARAISVARRHLAGLPIIADGDTGFGDETNTFRTVQTYEIAGAAAVQLEDQVFPKRCGHLDDKALVEADEFCLKIEAATAARSTALIVARTDAVAVEGIDAALRRARRYAEAGADVIFVEAPQTIEQIADIPGAVDVPVIFNVVPGGKSPDVSREQLEEFGYAGAILPAATVGAAFSAMTAAMADIADGRLSSGPAVAPRVLFEAVGLDAWLGRRSSEVPTHA